jgi:PAS domain S-box-containing protein
MDGEKDSDAAEWVGTEVLDGASLAMVVTDPRLHDNPIVYVNTAFVSLTGYGRQMAIGRNWRFLNGPETDIAALAQLDAALAREEEAETVLLHYREDGTPFWNHLIVTPVHDEAGTLTAFMGVLREADGPQGRIAAPEVHDSLAMLRELQHRVKNHLGMVVSMIRVQASRKVDTGSFHALGRRIEALSLLYQEVLDQSPGNTDTDVVEIGPYLRHIGHVLSDIECRPGVTVSIECGAETSTVDTAARLGLLVSELLTNALQHAFAGRESGHVEVRLVRAADGRLELTVADDGIGMPDGLDWPGHARSIAAQTARASASDGELDTRGSGDRHGTGVGGSIVLSLLRSLGGELDVDSGAGGTTVRARIARV